jgi:hypothetical protein
MAKNERGLPPGFALNVPKRPVDLGDYLDEDPPIVRPTIAKSSSPEPAVEPIIATPPEPVQPPPLLTIAATESFSPPPASSPVFKPITPKAAPQLTPRTVSSRPANLPTARVTPKALHPPRRQFNLNEDTLRLLDELVQSLQLQTEQRDVRASEVIHGLVLAISEARDHLDASRVPRRGQWGSSNAAHFPFALKDAFRDAILRAGRR